MAHNMGFVPISAYQFPPRMNFNATIDKCYCGPSVDSTVIKYLTDLRIVYIHNIGYNSDFNCSPF